MAPSLATLSFADAQFRSVWGRLVAARRVLLVSPRKPDGDSVGSICGLGLALRGMGRDPVLYCPDPIPAQFDGIPGAHGIMSVIASPRSNPGIAASRTPRNDTAFDIIVVVDSSDLSFAGIAEQLPQWKAKDGVLVVIDHHATNTMFGDVNLVLQASSTTQIITAMLEANRIPLTPDIATALFFGLVTDTDSFTNPATSAAAAATAARLVAAGARPGPILTQVYRQKPIGAIQLWGRAFERLRVHPRWNVAMTVLLPEDFTAFGDVAEHAEGLSNFLQTVLPVRAVLVLKDRGDGTVRGSLRTTRDGVDLGMLAKYLGGGGHKKASGFGVPGRLVRTATYWRVE
ncbi:MAG: DHH family phosphoesterase [bacterium]|nr:DHH family phosphoesterase [bacterium]